MEMDITTDKLADKFLNTEVGHEGKITKTIEKQTAKIPSVFYLSLAVGSIALSAGLAMSEKRKGWANFVGLWVPSLLLLGVYNKIVKVEGSDREERNHLVH